MPASVMEYMCGILRGLCWAKYSSVRRLQIFSLRAMVEWSSGLKHICTTQPWPQKARQSRDSTWHSSRTASALNSGVMGLGKSAVSFIHCRIFARQSQYNDKRRSQLPKSSLEPVQLLANSQVRRIYVVLRSITTT